MHDIPPRLILASQSPRRRQLLKSHGYAFEVIPPSEDAESGTEDGEAAPLMVSRLAWQKAGDVAPRVDAGIVIGCDTVAEYQGQVLGKPRDRADAREMLTLLRGTQHHVHSGICLWRRPDDRVVRDVATSLLQMDAITDEQLEGYLDSNRWRGKAGAFGYQDGNDWLQILAGSESNVVGLPMERLAALLSRFTERP